MPADVEGLSRIERAGLRELGDVAVDDVLATLDDVPDYRLLYYRWEHQQWAAGAIDFSEDHRQWHEDLSPAARKTLSWLLASFYAGEERVMHALVPFADVAPTEEQQVFLTSQLADKARHLVFFDRFFARALDHEEGDMAETLAALAQSSATPSQELLSEKLTDISMRSRSNRDDLGTLVEGVALCHIVMESTVYVTQLRFLLAYARDAGLLPGFRSGGTAVARDEARHVAFGVRFLRDMVKARPAYARVIESTLAESLPVALEAFEPPGGGPSYFDALPYGPKELASYALGSLSKRVQAIGVELPAA